jgi:hydrogenase maturation protein HypF
MTKRLHIVIRGAVQGVGFRPFIYRLATEMLLTGWVLNSTRGVFIEVEGDKEILDRFLLRVQEEKPPRSFIQSCESSFFDPVGYTSFEIRHSDDKGDIVTIVLPDIATCPECLQEIFDPKNRRYRYSFTNCTNCGPRYSIIDSLPYDRPNTTMKIFPMCDECRKEYDNPLDRRFHAQPNACPKCGPHLELWKRDGLVCAREDDALSYAIKSLHDGKIVAMKGIGGFHLLVDARNDVAVRRLRERKHREEKPLAVLFPSINATREVCEVSELEERMLLSSESPIVLLKKINHAGIAESIAPSNPYLGVMLPYSPLHHLLMNDLKFPVVATSGNFTDEPICTDEQEVIKRLGTIADIFLVHNRPIKRHVDDSIVRIMAGRESILRRARGYAPLPIEVHSEFKQSIIAVGAQLKNAIAVNSGNNVFISQHIGDLETKEAIDAFHNVIDSVASLFRVTPTSIAADLHPEYASTKYARGFNTTTTQIQHHHAHIASCVAENRISGSLLGVAWDGTGLGTDGTIWGGEFFRVDGNSYNRVATFRSFKLPGGEQAIREPWRIAVGILNEISGIDNANLQFLPVLTIKSNAERRMVIKMMERNINTLETSSAGRLFDAVASLIGVRHEVSFEGQAAMELEFSIGDTTSDASYEIQLVESPDVSRSLRIDWEPLVVGIIEDVRSNLDVPRIALKFHNTLVESIIQVAQKIGERQVVLSGGCFQNKYLTERTIVRLLQEGFRPYWHQRVPPNDGGIALGQLVIAGAGKYDERPL